MDDFELIVLHDKEIEALVQANVKYAKFIHEYPNGKKILYLE